MKKTFFALAATMMMWSGAMAQFNRTVVVEEGTGTWCPWCVRGIAALEHMNQKFGGDGSFIGIAVHAGDPMAVKEYASSLNLDGYPGCNVNRSLTNMPVGIEEMEEYFNTVAKEQTWAKVDVSAKLADNAVAVSAQVETKRSTALNIAYVLVEDGVTGYAQRNAYADGKHGAMGGFESKSANISDQVFNDVARAIKPGYDGTLLAIEKGKAKATCQIDIPENVANKSKLSVVALLIDTKSGEIINAAKCAVKQ